jgi:hypothetical protein
MSNIRLAFMSAIGIGSFAYRTGSYFPYLDYYLRNSKLSSGVRPLVFVPKAGTIIHLTQGSGKVTGDFSVPSDQLFYFPGNLINLNEPGRSAGALIPYSYAIVLKYYGQGYSGRV